MRASLAIGDDDEVLLFCGKISARKGPDLLLSASAEVAHRVERLHVLFLGDGALVQQLRERVPGNVSVRFLGFKNQTELSRYYHCADLLVMPSRHGETWGLVVNEALQHGLACVVSSEVGCAPDLIRDGLTGAVCDADASSLARAIERCIGISGSEEGRERCRAAVADYTVAAASLGVRAAFAQIRGSRSE
jgi:glycosyltransferase involved in cell wall biosynthesis